MAYIRERKECLTGVQDSTPWTSQTDLQYDFVMVYGTDSGMPDRVRKYREKGYVVHLMTGSAWGSYQDYLNGEWDGIDHWDESQMDRNGNPILHGVNVPYLCPTLSFCQYLTEKTKVAVDVGVEAVHLEEPEFWDEGGYSPAFQREYKAYYGEEWQPPHLSCENRYRVSALKVFLYRRLVEYVSRGLKEYAKEKYGRDLKFYVPTHSLVNYTQWKILSPEGTLLDIPTVDGCIAQVWTVRPVLEMYTGDGMRNGPLRLLFWNTASCRSWSGVPGGGCGSSTTRWKTTRNTPGRTSGRII